MKIWLSLLFALPLLSAPAWAADGAADGEPEQVVWRGAPIRIDLRLGEERVLSMPGAGEIRVGLLGGPVPGLRVQALGDHVYLLAKQPFAGTRAILKPDAGAPVLIDIAASARFGAGRPIEILAPRAPESARADKFGEEAAPETESPAEPVGYVELVRHAAQSIYAPPRLAPRSSRIVPIPVPRLPNAPGLMRGGAVRSEPVAAWRARGPDGPLWVTAVRMRNVADTPVVLDPRDLRGSWLAAAFQHGRLAPHGDETDTTTAYLVSSRPFSEIVAPWLVPTRKPADRRHGDSAANEVPEP